MITTVSIKFYEFRRIITAITNGTTPNRRTDMHHIRVYINVVVSPFVFPTNKSTPRILLSTILKMATHRLMGGLISSIFIIILSVTSLVKATRSEYVTCSSVLKLLNVDYNVRLHSHDIKYGSGSGQQSVTGTEVKEDGNSYWLVKAPTGRQCMRGKPIMCGEIIRLEHVATKKNLHSHHVSSPLSGKQEVSAYGDANGEGDSGDHWKVVCSSDYWEKGEPVIFHHLDTKVFLSVSGRTYGSPIAGQVEVVGEYSEHNSYNQWKTMEGVFIDPVEMSSKHNEHTEL